MNKQTLFSTGGCRVVNDTHSTERWGGGKQDNREGLPGLVPWWETVPPKGLEKGDSPDIPKVYYLRCKKGNRQAQLR